MRVWRIFDPHAAHASRPGYDPLAGEGGLHAPGRWHHRGTPMLYTSASPSLALLETLVHLVPADFGERTLLELEIPAAQAEAAETVTRTRLVQLLRDAPAGDPERETRAYGTAWARSERSLVLWAPSLVMPLEGNAMLNPRHPGMAEVRVVGRERVTLDGRLRLRREGDR